MTVVLCAPVSLTVCSLSDVPFVLGRLEFHFPLLEVFHDVNVLIVWGGFEIDEEHGKWRFDSILFDVPNI
jgi:hypothetical protein